MTGKQENEELYTSPCDRKHLTPDNVLETTIKDGTLLMSWLNVTVVDTLEPSLHSAAPPP